MREIALLINPNLNSERAKQVLKSSFYFIFILKKIFQEQLCLDIYLIMGY